MVQDVNATRKFNYIFSFKDFMAAVWHACEATSNRTRMCLLTVPCALGAQRTHRNTELE